MKKEFNGHKQQKQKPIDEIVGIEKQRIKIIKAKIYSLVVENCQSKNPHFEGIIHYSLFFSVIIVHFVFNFILIQKKSESKIK